MGPGEAVGPGVLGRQRALGRQPILVLGRQSALGPLGGSGEEALWEGSGQAERIPQAQECSPLEEPWLSRVKGGRGPLFPLACTCCVSGGSVSAALNGASSRAGGAERMKLRE